MSSILTNNNHSFTILKYIYFHSTFKSLGIRIGKFVFTSPCFSRSQRLNTCIRQF